MSRNYLGATEAWKQEQVTLARAILAGHIEFRTPEDREFHERRARQTLSFHGIPTAPTEDPKANGDHQAKGEATANDLPAPDERQGSLF